MGDSCGPIGLICEHYLTFSKSLFRVILCLLSQRKNCAEIPSKSQRVFDRGKGELEKAKGSERESTFTFKMAFLECFQTFLLTTSRAERYSAYKIKVLHSQH